MNPQHHVVIIGGGFGGLYAARALRRAPVRGRDQLAACYGGVPLAAVLAAAVAVAQLEISRSTIDGGGVMRSTGGDLELSGSIGQPDAGAMTGGNFVLHGGFWFQTPPGDCNADGAAGLTDVASLCPVPAGRLPPNRAGASTSTAGATSICPILR